ncbi:MAG TPA: YtxH domain-containing protein [Gemmatimonadales bacterium]|nr:YtxH domain-containing protein [Gemmatimonadales bacterium]
MARIRPRSEVVYVERGGDPSAKWLFWGALLGAGLALLYAPRSGEETRRLVQRRLWKLRAMTEEKLDEFSQQLGGRRRGEFSEPADEEDEDDLEPDTFGNGLGRPASASARQDLERRLAEARSRRRAASADIEEPLA